MLDEQTIERIVEKVLRRLLVELSDGGQHPPRITAEEARRALATLPPEPAPPLASYAPPPMPAPAWSPPVVPPPPRPVAPAAHCHPGRLLSEDELVSYYRRGIRVLQLEPRCLVTPAARDRARDLQVDLLEV